MLTLLKPYGDPSIERELVGGLVEVRGLDSGSGRDPAQALQSALAAADLLMGDVEIAVTEDRLKAAPRLRAVVCRSIGVDFVDIAAATRRGVLVLNSPVFCVTAVAEYALSLMLCLAHRLPQAARVMRDGAWEDRETLRGTELTGKTLGLVGLGRIGRELARMAGGIGMKVIACDPYCQAPPDGVVLLPLDGLLAQSDVVSVHSPLTPETRGMIGPDQLNRMKRGALLINVSRGGIVDEPSLRAALESGQIGAAGLDVLANEPAGPGECFYHTDMPSVLLTPHVAWNTAESFIRNQELFHGQIASLAKGSIPAQGIVNPAVTERWLQRWNGKF